MSTVLWTFYGRDFMRRNEMSLTNSNLNGTLSASGAAASSSSFAPGFIQPPSASNPQVPDHLAPRAFNYTEGCSSSMRGANGQLGASGSVSQGGPQEPSGTFAVRQFHSNGQQSLQQRPPQQQKAGSASSTATSERYKTELCRPFEESGICRYGHKCQFAHGSRELRTLSRHPKYKTEPCRTFHSVGFCPYGTRCHFIHNQPAYQPVPSGSISAEQSSTNGRDAEPLAFNQEPQPRLQPVSSASSSGVPVGHSHPLEAPVLANQPMNSGMHLPSSYPAATTPSTCCAAVAAASAAASAAAVFYRNGGVPCTTCASNTLVFGQGMGGYSAPMAFQNQNLAAGNAAAAYYHNQQQSQAAPGQFQLPMARPPAIASAPNAAAPTAAAAVAPGATAGTFVSPGTAAAVPAASAGTAGAHATAASVANANAAEEPEQPFNLQLPGTQSEQLVEFNVLTSNLGSLLGTHSFDNLLNCALNTSSLDFTGSPNVQPSRRLPIFSHLSDTDK